MDPTTSGGVMLYNDPNQTSDNITITGHPQGVVKLSGLASGPYQGMLLWQEQSSTVPINIEGDGNFNVTGTFYAANAVLKVTGNGAATVGSQFISRLLQLSGNGNMTIDFDGQKVAKVRQLNLVE